MNFCTLPDTVRGYSVTNLTYLGILQLAMLPLQQSQMLSPEIGLLARSFTFTTTATSSPYFQSETPTTCASSSAPIFIRYSSSSFGQMFSPPRIIMSFILPTIDRQPSSSSTPKSPDFIHPASMLLFVASSSPQQFSITAHPRTQNSPTSPGLQTSPLALTIFASRPGRILPTVVVLRTKESVGQVWKETGEVSVMPQQFVMSLRLSTPMILVMSASEQTAPATMPVLSCEISQCEEFSSKCRRYSMNMVGTPQSEVHLYLSTALSVFLGSKPSQIMVMAAPRTSAAKVPMIMPKQWQKGTGTAMLSRCVYLVLKPMASALLRMLKWESVAALGRPVVPEVNWMLAGSLGSTSQRSSEAWAGCRTSLKLTKPLTLSCHSLIRTTLFSEGILGDLRSKALRLSISGMMLRTTLRQSSDLKRSFRKSTLTPTFSRVQASSSLWQLGLMLTRMRSAIAAAIWMITHSLLLQAYSPILSLGLSPKVLRSPVASCSAFSSTCWQVSRWS